MYNLNIFSPAVMLFLCLIACRPQYEVDLTPGNLSSETFTWDGEEREYLLYFPANYVDTKAVPLLLSFHGAFGTKEKQYELSQFHQLADEENFILVTPESQNLTWNHTGDPGRADDIGFINALLDDLLSRYPIDPDRVYAAGSSNGGYFSFQLACELSDRIASVVSVKGGMNEAQLSSCDPTRPVPVLQLHGTEDQNVPYEVAEAAINFWKSHNQTASTPTITDLPDIDPQDGSTVQYFIFGDGQNDATVEHFKVIGGGHNWFGSELEPDNNDINASEEAWKFLKKFDLNGIR
ncbi:MAG: PHB depolymerase family esterase [Bacteroidota bacterium]